MYNGFIKVATISPKLEIGNPKFNIKEILKSLENNKASICVFPELCITSYTCGDLFFQNQLINEAYQALNYFLDNNSFEGIVILGMPIKNEGNLYNCAVVINCNQILGIIPKSHLANSGEYSEKRYFKSNYNRQTNKCFLIDDYYPFGNIIFHDQLNNLHFSVEICHDMWHFVTPGNILASKGVNMMFNLSASNEYLYKEESRRNTVIDNSRKNNGAYIYVSANASESTSQTVYSSHNMVCVNGKLVNECTKLTLDTKVLYTDIDVLAINFNRFKNTDFHEEMLNMDVIDVDFNLSLKNDFKFEKQFGQTPFVPNVNVKESHDKIIDIIKYSLAKRLKHIGVNKVILGLSGGLDSTMALLVCYETFKMLNIDVKNIICITMPTKQTTSRTKNNAIALANKLGVTLKEKSIEKATLDHFDLIEHDANVKDITFENSQARIRTLILMNLANKENAIVIGTGDMSELALGFCTYGGDQLSMYNLNASIPKTLIRFLVNQFANNEFLNVKDILVDIINTPISPELKEEQETEKIIGSYEVNDFILYRYLTAGDSFDRLSFLIQVTFKLSIDESNNYVDNFFKRFFTSQYKRSASADGVKVLEVSLDARHEYKMPSDIKRWV